MEIITDFQDHGFMIRQVFVFTSSALVTGALIVGGIDLFIYSIPSLHWSMELVFLGMFWGLVFLLIRLQSAGFDIPINEEYFSPILLGATIGIASGYFIHMEFFVQ